MVEDWRLLRYFIICVLIGSWLVLIICVIVVNLLWKKICIIDVIILILCIIW